MILMETTTLRHVSMILAIAVNRLARALHGTKNMIAVPIATIVRMQPSSLPSRKRAMPPHHPMSVTAGAMRFTIRKLVHGTWEIVVLNHARCINGIRTMCAAPMATTV